MSVLDYIILSVVMICMALAAWFIFGRRKKGKCIGCSGCCESCPHHKGGGENGD